MAIVAECIASGADYALGPILQNGIQEHVGTMSSFLLLVLVMIAVSGSRSCYAKFTLVRVVPWHSDGAKGKRNMPE